MPGAAVAAPVAPMKRRRWYLGIQSKKDPAHVMTEVRWTSEACGCWSCAVSRQEKEGGGGGGAVLPLLRTSCAKLLASLLFTAVEGFVRGAVGFRLE